MEFYFLSSGLRFSKDSMLRGREMKDNTRDHWDLGLGTVKESKWNWELQDGDFWELLGSFKFVSASDSPAIPWMFPSMVKSHILKIRIIWVLVIWGPREGRSGEWLLYLPLQPGFRRHGWKTTKGSLKWHYGDDKIGGERNRKEQGRKRWTYLHTHIH